MCEGLFALFLKDNARLTIFWETNAMGVVLEEEDEVKLRYTASIMTTLRN